MKFLLFLSILSSLVYSSEHLNSDNSNVIKTNINSIYFSFKTNIKDINIELTKENTWVRLAPSIIVPKARINITSKRDYTYKYAKEFFYSQKTKLKTYTHFFISPYLHNTIEVFEKNKLIGTINLSIKNQKRIYTIDKSCNSVKFKFKNLTRSSLILGCSFRESKNGQRDLKLSFVHINSKDIKSSFVDNNSVLNYKSDDIDIQIKPSYKNKTKKFSLAFGFGPYGFNTSIANKNMDTISAAAMLYSNYKFDKDTSVRAFSASIFDVSSFHNFGIYLANNIAKIDDSDLIITTLLGVQYLDYRFDSNSKSFNSPLYPQGIEFTYKNLFTKKNYILSGGIFINPTDSNDYQNAWVRWGEKYYYELNYINWSSKEFKANMWGLSLILPIL